LPIVALEHEIYFVTGLGPEIAARNRRIRPADLLEDLTDGECLKQVAVLSKSRGICLCDLLRVRLSSPGHHAGIDHVDLGVLDDPGTEGGAPGRETVDEEDGVEKLGVVLRRRPLRPIAPAAAVMLST